MFGGVNSSGPVEVNRKPPAQPCFRLSLECHLRQYPICIAWQFLDCSSSLEPMTAQALIPALQSFGFQAWTLREPATLSEHVRKASLLRDLAAAMVSGLRTLTRKQPSTCCARGFVLSRSASPHAIACIPFLSDVSGKPCCKSCRNCNGPPSPYSLTKALWRAPLGWWGHAPNHLPLRYRLEMATFLSPRSRTTRQPGHGILRCWALPRL